MGKTSIRAIMSLHWVSEKLSGCSGFQVDPWSVPRASRSSSKSKNAVAQVAGTQGDECAASARVAHFWC